ncbi:MAG: DegV family protein [Chloroflexi bacterium]|nr:DegV family protein [Chloroflexota bacterium]
MHVKIVTDSACDVPQDLADRLDITIVPVYINVGERSYLDGVELSRQTFFDNLATYTPYPTTAAPAVGAFTETYEQLAQSGVTEILSIHMASQLSATYNAARLGAEAVTGTTITLFDSKQISLGAGLLIIMAAEAAKNGRSIPEIVAMLTERVTRTRLFGMLDTLDSLRRSGRVSWAQFGFGTILQIKPIMMISDGIIEVIAKVRTRKRSTKQLLSLVQGFGPFEQLAIVHVNALDAAKQLKELARPIFPETNHFPIMEIGPAVGTHLGVNAVGFACIATE